MKRTLLATTALALAAFTAHAVSPTVGNYSRDKNGVSAPILPMEDYVNKATIGVSGTATLTCPAGTNQFSTAASAGADYEVRRNGNGAACPASSSTGTAGSPRPNTRYWVPGTTDLTFCAVSGTTVYLSCWSYQ